MSLRPNSRVHSATVADPTSNGDLNVLGPFIPFASPIDPLWALAAKAKAVPTAANDAALAAARADRPKFPNHSFRCISRVFKHEEVALVVRLNDELYVPPSRVLAITLQLQADFSGMTDGISPRWESITLTCISTTDPIHPTISYEPSYGSRKT